MILRHFVRYSRDALRASRLAALSSVACLRVLPKQTQRPTAPSDNRQFATPPPQLNHSDISSERYHEYADATMDKLLESLEELLDTVSKAEYEVEYSSGVLTLKLGDKGTYVINKQPPNKQIWLSSPESGPKRYDYVQATDEWVYSRDGRSMGDLLNEELSKTLEREIDLDLSATGTADAPRAQVA